MPEHLHGSYESRSLVSRRIKRESLRKRCFYFIFFKYIWTGIFKKVGPRLRELAPRHNGYRQLRNGITQPRERMVFHPCTEKCRFMGEEVREKHGTFCCAAACVSPLLPCEFHAQNSNFIPIHLHTWVDIVVVRADKISVREVEIRVYVVPGVQHLTIKTPTNSSILQFWKSQPHSPDLFSVDWRFLWESVKYTCRWGGI